MVDRIIETQMRFINDRQATNQVLRDNARIDNSLEEIDNSADRLEDTYNDLERAAERQGKASREASEASIRAAKEQSELFGDVASRTSQLSGAFSGLGAIGGQRLMIAADLFDVVEAGQLLNAELPALVTQLGLTRTKFLLLGAAGGAIALTVLALKEYNKKKEEEKKRIEEARQALGLYVDKLLELNRLIVAGDGAGLEDALSQAEKSLAALRATRQDLQNQIDGIVSDFEEQIRELAPDLPEEEVALFAEAMAGIKDITELASFEQMGLFLQLKDTIGGSKEASEKTKLLNDQIEDYNGKIEASAVNLETTTDKIEDYNTAQEESATVLDRLVGKAKNVEKEAGALGDAWEASMRKVAKAQVASSKELVSGLGELVAEREKEADAIMKQTFAEVQRIDALGEGARAIAEAEAARIAIIEETEQKIVDVQAKTAQKRIDLIADTESKIADLQADLLQEQADSERDYRETIGEITRDFQQDGLQDLEDFQRDQLRAEEDHRDNILESVGKLDAIGILNEQRNFTKDQKREKEDFKTEQKRRAKEFKQRLKDEEKAFKREQQLALRSYRERERDLRDALNRQLADQRSAQTQEIAALRGHQAQRLSEIDSALDTELRELTGFTEDEITIRDDHYAAMLTQLEMFVDDANTTLEGLGGGGAVGAPSIPSTPGAVGQFPLSSGALQSGGGLLSPFSSPSAMMPPISRAFSTTNNMPQVTNNFSGMDRLSPGQIRNVVKIVNNEMLRALA